jgi:predicted AAA+ superfamily ATPase
MLPIKVLRGPRQVGKTSLLQHLGTHEVFYFDDAATRIRAEENPRLFLEQLPSKVILDEAPFAPALFPELKRRVDAARLESKNISELDVWITGSNQTLLQREIRESLAGRASFLDLAGLSIEELKQRYRLSDYLFRGGWPELYVSEQLSVSRYLNDLIASFIERDIVNSAGIERKAAFTKCLGLTAGRVGQLFNFSDVAANVSADVTTVQSWVSLLEENGILRRLQPYYTNLNQRLIKAPKFYFEDVALATRLQGWTEIAPLMVSPSWGPLLENIAVSEIAKFFINRGQLPQLNYIRTKEKVEIDLLVQLPNQRYVAIEVKATPQDLTTSQMRLLESLRLNIVERWIVSPQGSGVFQNSKVVTFEELSKALERLTAR